jgi:hypothetical protein
MRAGTSRAATKIGLGISARLHAATDRIDGIGRLDRPALALIASSLAPVGAPIEVEHHGSFRLGSVMMDSTASETIGAILAATRC